MERNEDHPFMISIREQQNPDTSKPENNPDFSKINDISTMGLNILASPVQNEENDNSRLAAPPVLDKNLSSNRSSPLKKRLSHFAQETTPGLKSRNTNKNIDVFKTKEKKNDRFAMVSKFLDHKAFQITVSCCTIYALFADDFRIICTMKSTDNVFDGFTFFCFAMFFVEIILSIFVKKGYAFSFFFYLDLISTFSLIIDITFINEQIFGDSSNSQTFAKKAGKASQIGTRTGRIIRLVRLIRIVKLYKTWQNSVNKKVTPTSFEDLSPNSVTSKSSRTKSKLFRTFNVHNTTQVLPSPLENSQFQKESPGLSASLKNLDSEIFEKGEYVKPAGVVPENHKESRVGKRLSDLTMKRVIILVLILIFVVPLFNSAYYFDPDLDYTIQLKIMTAMSTDTSPNTTAIQQLYDDYIGYNAKRSNPIVFCRIPSINMVFQNMNPDDLRNQEKQELSYLLPNYDQPFRTTISVRTTQIYTSMVNILRTLFVCCVLAFGAYFFNKDIGDLALKPIERMIDKVNKIASNPLASKEQSLISAKDKMQFETSIIENAITKIGVLLALGFGEAGSEIIASNIAKSGDVDPMIPGKKRFSVFGFCDIRNFTDATEVLQQEVMVFVNTIAYIVHKTVDKYGGIANKNIGDAFLLVWKFPEEEIEYYEDGSLQLKRTPLVKNQADLCVISFSKIIAGINKKPAILKYRENQGLNARLPNYKVKMGFGLHIGWAIEGAIGSEYKIDASYLSPNVNLASRLEAATKQYGVPLLISHELHHFFSKRTKKFCREIDRVTVKGSKKPIGLFTIDLMIEKLLIQEAHSPKRPYQKKMNHMRAKNSIMELVVSPTFKSAFFFEIDNDLLLMTGEFPFEFKEKFNEAFELYIKGDWMEASGKLSECLGMNPLDGPSQTLMKVIGEKNFVADADWQGFRELTEK